MRLSTISEKLKKDYKKRILLIKIAYVALIVIIVYLNVGPNPFESPSYPLPVILVIALRLAVYMISLYLFKLSTFNIANRCPYIDIDKKGIEAEFSIDGRMVYRLYTWDELTRMDGKQQNIGFSTKNPKKYKFALIHTGQEREMPAVLRPPFPLIFKFRKTLKEEIATLPSQNGEELIPNALYVELYDEMLAEIRKYWRKDRGQ